MNRSQHDVFGSMSIPGYASSISANQGTGSMTFKQLYSTFKLSDDNNVMDPAMPAPPRNSLTLSFSSSSKVPLPHNYTPSPCTVVIGRGKFCSDASGSNRLRAIAINFLERYSKATTKVDKSVIVSNIVSIVEASCPSGDAFVKFIDGQWYEVDNTSAREKVGYVLRDLLADQYRSSSKSKAALRRSKDDASSNKRQRRDSTTKDSEEDSSSSSPSTSAVSSHSNEKKAEQSPAGKKQSLRATSSSPSSQPFPATEIVLVQSPCLQITLNDNNEEHSFKTQAPAFCDSSQAFTSDNQGWMLEDAFTPRPLRHDVFALPSSPISCQKSEEAMYNQLCMKTNIDSPKSFQDSMNLLAASLGFLDESESGGDAEAIDIALGVKDLKTIFD